MTSFCFCSFHDIHFDFDLSGSPYKTPPFLAISSPGTFLDALLPALRVAGKSLKKEAHVDDQGLVIWKFGDEIMANQPTPPNVSPPEIRPC